MNTTHRIAHLVHGFFRDYLTAQRGLSDNTIFSYRDSVKLLLKFVSERIDKPLDKLLLEDIDTNMILAFLDDLETTRGNCAQTRNCRLSALRAFFRHVAAQEPTLLLQCQSICDIPLKRTPHRTIEYLEETELRAMLDSVDPNARNARRDYALLLFLYNTGARAQEVVDLKLDDLSLQSVYQVQLTGKGSKQRICPLWQETVTALEQSLQQRPPHVRELSSVFLNAKGKPLTRFGLRYIVRKYAAKAALQCPSLKSKKTSPHTIRHSTAMTLLQATNDITVVKDWLGHADVNTTHGYVEANLAMKRKALEACEAPKAGDNQRQSKWRTPSLLQWLEELSNSTTRYVESCSDFVFPDAQAVGG